MTSRELLTGFLEAIELSVPNAEDRAAILAVFVRVLIDETTPPPTPARRKR